MGTHGERLIGLSLKAATFSPVENPAGDTIFCGCGSTAECGRAKAETTVRFRPPAPFRGRSSSAERSRDMREAERAALSAPTIFEGIAQSAERMRHMH